MGDVEVTFPSGGSTTDLDVQVMFQDITASGGQTMNIELHCVLEICLGTRLLD